MSPSEECSLLEQRKIPKNLGSIFYIVDSMVRYIALNRYSDISCKPLHIINYTKTISLPTPSGCGSFLVAHVVHYFVFLLIVVASKLWRQYTQKMVSGEVFTEGCQSTTWELCHKYLSCLGCTSSQDSFLQLLRPRAPLSFTYMYG